MINCKSHLQFLKIKIVCVGVQVCECAYLWVCEPVEAWDPCKSLSNSELTEKAMLTSQLCSGDSLSLTSESGITERPLYSCGNYSYMGSRDLSCGPHSCTAIT